MKIVVPISRSDVHRLPNWVEAVKKFGGLESHSILFLPTLSVAAKAYEAAGKLGDVCKDTRVHPLEMDNERGWPMASNWQWFRATEIMEELQAPWFWMELDCLPVRQGWATEIGSDYTSGGTPFRGCVVKTPWKRDDGVEVESLEGPSDKMMCGCGVYPAALYARLKAIGQSGIMMDFSKGDSSAEIPWDLHMRHAMRALGMGHSNIFGDYWNTQNYRVEDGKLICDAKETGNDGKKVAVHRAGIVNPNAVVIHGAKDDSLYKLIMAGLDTRNLAPIFQPADPSAPAPIESEEVKLLKEQIKFQDDKFSRLESMFMKMMQDKKDEPMEPIRTVTTTESSVNRIKSDRERVVDCIKASPKKLKLTQVSEMTSIPLNKLKAMCREEDSPFDSSTGLGWIKLTEVNA